MRKASQRREPSFAVGDDGETAGGARAWRKDAIAAILAGAAGMAIVANAAFLQSGPHPAPMFSGKSASLPASLPAPAPKSIRVVGQEITGPPLPVAAPRARPAEPELAKADPAKADPPATPRPRNEVIADIQRELARRGFYDGAPDGVHGPKTDAAMRDFEQAAGIRPGSEPNEIFLRALTRSPAKAASRTAAAAPAPTDPIAELIAPSTKRILAVQRALTDFGYGQFKPNGTFGPETKEAIQQFERARKMPVTGQISPRLLRELAALTGRPLE